MNKFHWSVDSLIFRKNTIFGFGWFFHEDMEISTLNVQALFAENQQADISAEHGKSRIDVATAYPQFRFAKSSGFLVYGSYPELLENALRIDITGTLKDGTTFSIQVPPSQLKNLDTADAAGKPTDVRRLHNDNRVEIADTLLRKAGKNVVLVIDHDMGGGANQYREKLVEEKLDRGDVVMIFTYNVPTLKYRLYIRDHQSNEHYEITEPQVLVDLTNKVDLKEIIYNDAVSFASPNDIPRLIMELKAVGNRYLRILVHDFFLVCPSHFLLNHQGTFCHVPDIKECQGCLAKNQQGFSTLYSSRDIVQWRALWYRVLRVADEVIVFSDSSLKLLSRAYPQLDSARVHVRPHTVNYIGYEPIEPFFVGSLRIGVVGHIAYHKGAHIVQELSHEIARRNLDIKIIVFGTIDANCDTNIVKETGQFKHAELPDLIQYSGANIFLFPSICPETFSYVVHELMALECAVACFDLGAPAERIGKYPKGLVLHDQDAASLLDSLIEFHRKIYLSPRKPSTLMDGDKRIGNLTQALAERYRQINELEKAVASKDTEIANYRARLVKSEGDSSVVSLMPEFTRLRVRSYLRRPRKIIRKIWESLK
jgi:glycosyltransferase involved in cell wall biosynthesis